MPVIRHHAQRGETVRLRITFRTSGTPFDPFEVRAVEIRDPSGVLIDTITAIVKDAVGEYHVDWAVPTTADLGFYSDTWYATATVGATEKPHYHDFYVFEVGSTSLVTPYLTTSEQAAWVPDGTELSGAELANIAAIGQEIIETACGQKFVPVTMARVFDGSGRGLLQLDYWIREITMVEYLNGDGTTWEDVTSTVSDFRIAKSNFAIGIGNLTSFSQGGGYTGRRRHTWSCDYRRGCGWPAGFQNVRITGSWGKWATPPLQIKQANGMLIEIAGECDNPQGDPDSAYESEDVKGGRNYKLRQILKSAMTDRSTGNPDIDAKLARFRRVRPPRVIL